MEPTWHSWGAQEISTSKRSKTITEAQLCKNMLNHFANGSSFLKAKAIGFWDDPKKWNAKPYGPMENCTTLHVPTLVLGSNFTSLPPKQNGTHWSIFGFWKSRDLLGMLMMFDRMYELLLLLWLHAVLIAWQFVRKTWEGGHSSFVQQVVRRSI